MKEANQNKYGLSKKTNIALAAIAGITTAAEHWEAIVAITIIGIFCVSAQFFIDRSNQE